MATKSLTFDLYGRDRTASKAIRGVGDEAQGVAGRLKGFSAVAGVALAAVGAAAVSFGVDAVQAAVKADTQWRKTTKLFGENADAIKDWSADAAENFGISGTAAMTAAADFGNMYLQLGVAGEEAVKLSTKSVELAADLAAFNGLDTAEVVDMISSAFRGEYDSLQRLIPNISDARVKTEALAATGKTNAEELTNQEKAMAVLAIVTGDGAAAMGAAGDKADTFGGKVETLNAKFEDVKTKVGTELMPAMDTLISLFDDDEAVDGFADAVGDLASDLGAVKSMVEDIQALGDWFEGGGLASEESRDVMDDNIIKGGGALGGMVSWSRDMEQAWHDFWGGLTEDQNTWSSDFNTGWQNAWGGAQSSTETGMSNVRGGMGGGFSGMSGDMSVFEEATKGRWSGMWGAVDGETQTGLGGVNTSTGIGIGAIGGTLAGLNPVAGAAFAAAWLAAQTATGTGWVGVDGSTRTGMSTVGGTLQGFRGVVQTPFSGASSWLLSAGQNIVQGLVGGIASMVGSAASAAATLAKNVVTGAKAALGIQSPSRVFREIGEFVGQGFELGIEDMQPRVAASVDAMIAAPRTVTAAGGGAGVNVYVTNKAGAAISDLIEIEIEKHGRRQKVALESGSRWSR